MADMISDVSLDMPNKNGIRNSITATISIQNRVVSIFLVVVFIW